MFYYYLVFNRPYFSNYDTLGELVYASEDEISVGTRVMTELKHSKIMGVVVGDKVDKSIIDDFHARNIPIKTIASVLDKTPLLNHDQIMLAKWMAEYYLASWGECIFTMIPSAQKERDTEFSEEIISHFEMSPPHLTDSQKLCVEKILQAFDNEQIDMSYLYGVTGSGKTEVFLSVIAHLIEKGKQVIYLVPEITLVLQIYPLFCARFGKHTIGVLHSKVTKSQKLSEWNRIKSGEVRIVLGVRSAVFAPCTNLGAIILDEEHDSSYKSENTPRYHTRHIAMTRCKHHDAMVLMGSATPSVEAWAYKSHNTMQFLTLPTRISGGAIPTIEFASLQNTVGCLSMALQESIMHTLNEHKQVLLLLNRRGFSHTFLCRNCGHMFSCPHCSVNLVYHQDVQDKNYHLQCHHCGYHSCVPESCPQCHYVNLGMQGWGIQRVVQELTHIFPKSVIARLDTDVNKKKDEGRSILGRFYRGEINILVGTQMIAKGINFPHLQLVGVLFGDSLLGIPDFRSEERAYALLQQVAGRAGRFSQDGKVIIQGYGLDNKVFTTLKESNQDSSFYDQEIAHRKKFNLTPFTRLLRVVFRGVKEEKVVTIANLFVKKLQALFEHKDSEPCTIMGPVACMYARLSNNYRYHVVLSASTQRVLIELCKHVLGKGVKVQANRSQVYIEIDPDPLHFS